jgi:PadR family transcriptional regulator AphA
MTGYELKKHMDNSTQFFWYAALSQIYPALKKLENEGLVTSEKKPQEGMPDKKIYTITEKGKTVFLKWLQKPIDELPPAKQPNLLKLFFSGILDKETIIDNLQRQLELHKKQLKKYQQNTAEYIKAIIDNTGLIREGLMWELVRQFGEDFEHTYIQWLQHCIEKVEQELEPTSNKRKQMQRGKTYD